MTFNAVVFDMDGVLVNTVEYHYRSWKRVSDEFGLTFSREDNERLRGLARRKSLEVLLKGRIVPKEVVHEILERKNKYFLESMKNTGPGELLPGVLELLQELRAANIRIGVASSSRNAGHILDRLGIDGFIDRVMDGTAVRESKPAPNVFIHTAAALKVEPFQCIALEDSEAGIKAALSAGMCVLGIGAFQRVHEASAYTMDLSVVRLRQLREFYAAWRDAMGTMQLPLHQSIAG